MPWFPFSLGKVTPDRFARLVMRHLARHAHYRDTSYDAPQFCLRIGADNGGDAQTLHLRNAYADYTKAPRRERQRVLDKYVASFSGFNDTPDADTALERLMPVIRDRWTYEFVELEQRARGNAQELKGVLTFPFADHLVIAIVEDLPDTVRTVNRSMPSKWNMTPQAILQRATNNLRDHTQDKFRRIAPGVFLSEWHDIYDASRLLLTDMLYRLSLAGDPVIAIPSRNHLIVTGSRDEHGLAMMAALSAEILEDDTRPLAEDMYRLVDGRWEVFHFPHAARDRLRKVAYLRQRGTYDDQKALLDKIHQAKGVDVFVATYALYESSKLGGLFSMAVWTGGVDTLLPRADYISLADLDTEDTVLVSWADLCEVIGALDPADGYYPPRHRVTTFPSDAQMQTLKARTPHERPSSDNQDAATES